MTTLSSSFPLGKESSFTDCWSKPLQCTLLLLSLCIWSNDVRCRVTIWGDWTFLSPWKLALEMFCHLAGSSRAIASAHRRTDAVPKTKGLYTTGEKLAANIGAFWLHSDLRSSLVISAAECTQKRTWTQHDVMASSRSQSIQGVGPLGISQLCSLGMQSVTHSALNTL